MRLLVDQDVYALTLHFLEDEGHDVVPVASIGLTRASDEDILVKAQELERIPVTRDRDFGNLVFVRSLGQECYTFEYRIPPSASCTPSCGQCWSPMRKRNSRGHLWSLMPLDTRSVVCPDHR